MAGIYIHIPFCKLRCYYCDFYSTVRLSYKQDFLKALIAELELRKDYLRLQKIKTIYFGGGTPSLLSPSEIQEVINKIKFVYGIDDRCEITLEANPEDLSERYIKELTGTFVNRISVGIQSFDDNDLQMLNRRHNGKQAIQSIENLKFYGFRNISADLIYGLPWSSLNKWEINLKQFTELKIPHLSAYHLTYETQTVFGSRLKKKQITPLKENDSVSQYKLLCQMINESGYFHYEISNFAKIGMLSQHNSNYWNNTPYLGLGPAAHSYDGNFRQWNQPNLFHYISNLKKDKLPPYEKEILSKTDKFNDYILTGLRNEKGISLIRIQNEFPKFFNDTKKNIEKLQKDSKHCLIDKDNFRLTEAGFFVSDRIISDFLGIND